MYFNELRAAHPRPQPKESKPDKQERQQFLIANQWTHTLQQQVKTQQQWQLARRQLDEAAYESDVFLYLLLNITETLLTKVEGINNHQWELLCCLQNQLKHLRAEWEALRKADKLSERLPSLIEQQMNLFTQISLLVPDGRT